MFRNPSIVVYSDHEREEARRLTAKYNADREEIERKIIELVADPKDTEAIYKEMNTPGKTPEELVKLYETLGITNQDTAALEKIGALYEQLDSLEEEHNEKLTGLYQQSLARFKNEYNGDIEPLKNQIIETIKYDQYNSDAAIIPAKNKRTNSGGARKRYICALFDDYISFLQQSDIDKYKELINFVISTTGKEKEHDPGRVPTNPKT